MPHHILDVHEYRDRTFIFRDRFHAGELLALKLLSLTLEKPQLLAIPSGGVPVGYAASNKIHAPLDLIIVRKIQIPWNTEAGFGALAWDGTLILNEELISTLELTTQVVDKCISLTEEVIRERLKKFRDDKPMPELNGKQVILVDDGLASGFTMLAAIKSVKKSNPEKVIVAVPTGSEEAVKLIAANVDELLCLNIRSGPVFAVADAYKDWYDLTDKEVINLLKDFRAD